MVPTDDCCFLYEDENFGTLLTEYGICVDNPEEQRIRDLDLSQLGWNNGIGSFSCGKNVTLTLTRNNGEVSKVNGALKVRDTEWRGSIDRA